MSEYDVVIAGGGHNALACAAVLCKNGIKTLVAERNDWVGGGAVTRELTQPGFKHDLFGSNHVWIHANPHIQEMMPELKEYGLEYLWGEDEIMGHPMTEGPGVIVYRDLDKTCDSIAQYSKKDAARYREIYDGFVEIKDGFIKNMFAPPTPPSYMPAAMERSPEGLRMLRNYNLSARAFVMENFENPHIQAFLISWALGPNIKPTQQGAGSIFYIMIPAIHVYGQAIPRGGSIELPNALAKYVNAHGGKVLTNSPVEKILVDNGVARGIRLQDGTEILAKKGVVSALEPQQTFLKLMDKEHLHSDFRRMVKNFVFGDVASFRVHFALHEAPIFKGSGNISKAPFQRTITSVADIDRHFAELSMGIPSKEPPIHGHCWSLRDPSRAPEGKHTFMIDTFVPSKLAKGNWADIKESYSQELIKTLRKYTTNMTDDNIIESFSHSPEDMEAMNPCFVGGVPSGGERTLSQLGYFRPFPEYSQYRGPLERMYLAGPSCHPGGGISGMGVITAQEMLKDFGLVDDE
ncbi:phytoene desaturase family protein [Govanella unica]|uniref:Pyridine nucleotide-disulfide oxidoreductase domain-containing protein 2 n=1 Tax=Govanella unica TaxID=2975056 RepID=A0A9X3Z776_9PROT|nr:NAD(P)/FAD-dependent oxidoreductase [Govania unica]MDA5193876.1 NAD(P)/FAD-dependent oxidoreductase [Govania unica]